MLLDPNTWKNLAPRYAQRRPRRVLALDGGGIRGVITARVLVELERQLKEQWKPDARLCDFFDYVGGTSTGAIIAACVAIGMPAQKILDFYSSFGAQIFRKRRWGVWDSLYRNGPLEKQLKVEFGDRTLEPQHLETLLLVVIRNATTDSAWPVSSNPDAKYNASVRADCNLRVPLWKLVRASTAAPVYFPAEVIEWDKDDPEKAFVFVDGGTTAYNNPAFLLTRMATEPMYRLGWERGEKQLLVVSVGTGSAPVLGQGVDDPDSNLVSAAATTLSALMSQAAYDQDINCRTVGRCTFGPVLDREVLDLVPQHNGKPIPLSQDLGRAFLYARYDADLSQLGLDAMGLDDVKASAVQKLDGVNFIDDLERIGAKVAENVSLAHFGTLGEKV